MCRCGKIRNERKEEGEIKGGREGRARKRESETKTETKKDRQQL